MTISDDTMILMSFISFIVAVMFRLLDNSGSILLTHNVYIESSYVSRSIIKYHLNRIDKIGLKKKLNSILIARNIHDFFLLGAILIFSSVIIINSFFT